MRCSPGQPGSGPSGIGAETMLQGKKTRAVRVSPGRALEGELHAHDSILKGLIVEVDPAASTEDQSDGLTMSTGAVSDPPETSSDEQDQGHRRPHAQVNSVTAPPASRPLRHSGTPVNYGLYFTLVGASTGKSRS